MSCVLANLYRLCLSFVIQNSILNQHFSIINKQEQNFKNIFLYRYRKLENQPSLAWKFCFIALLVLFASYNVRASCSCRKAFSSTPFLNNPFLSSFSIRGHIPSRGTSFTRKDFLLCVDAKIKFYAGSICLLSVDRFHNHKHNETCFH